MKTRVCLKYFVHDGRVLQNETTFINLTIDLLLKKTGNSSALLMLQEKIETYSNEE